MAQFAWTYTGKKGRPYRVGLYHGNRSGNLLIHCNAKVMIIDFQVKETKTYTFFLEEELCRIRLERKGDRMFYHFEIDKETDTPLNRVRKKQDRRHLWQTLLFFGGIIFLAIVTALIISSLQPDPDEKYRAAQVTAIEQLEQGTGTILALDNPKNGAFSYSITLDGVLLQRKESRSDIQRQWGKLVQEGDAFQVLWEKDPPYDSQLLIESPTPKQIDLFKQRVMEKEQEMLTVRQMEVLECFIDESLKNNQLRVLPLLYHRTLSVDENAYFNKAQFQNEIKPLLEGVSELCRPNFGSSN